MKWESRSIFLRLGLLALAAYSVFALWNIHLHKETHQWDFKAHYYAGRAHALGQSPYDRALLKHLAGSPVAQWYGYPPQVIWLYRFFNLFSYPAAYDAFLLFKALLLAGLLFLWRRHFIPGPGGPAFFLFALLAFNQTIYIDFLAGNTSLIEQVCLWAAFYFFLKDRLPAFCALIVLAANLKLTPIVLVFLLLLKKDRKKWLYLSASLAAFFGLQAVALLTSAHAGDFLALMARLKNDPGGINGPSTFTFLRAALSTAFGSIDGFDAERPALALFIPVAGLILYFSVRAFIRLARSPHPDGDRPAVFLACLTLSLLTPRMKDYYYIIAIVPAFYVLKKAVKPGASALIFLLLCLSLPPTSNLPGLTPLLILFWDYYPWISTLAVWVLMLGLIRREPLGKAATSSPSTLASGRLSS